MVMLVVWHIPFDSANAEAIEHSTEDQRTSQEARWIKKVVTHRKVVALTFDDGPSKKFTPLILDVLQKNHAKATFFVIGSRAEAFPDLIRLELEGHHQVANHSYQHQIMTGNSKEKISDELMNTQHAIEGVVDNQRQPRFFRPPRGRFNHQMLQVAEQHHYVVVLWSVDSRDWENPGTRTIVRRVLAQSRNGDIILFHDQGGSRAQTVASLKQILPELRHMGFEFVTVSELVRLADP